MKHLLIILISLLLLSSPVIGQETGVLYQYETSSGIKWKTFGNEKLQPKYEGEIKNGEMDGFGIMTYPYGEKSVVGEWKNGKEWNTKHTKKDGKLIGKFENGEWIVSWGVLYLGYRNGKMGFFPEKWEGIENVDNKDMGKYEGEIINGEPHGQGTFTLSDGSKYVGEWKNGFRNGQGTYNKPNGSIYVGEWKNGETNGQGTETYPSGSKYVGEYKDGERNGQGTFTYPDGGKYVGGWKDDKFHGQGTVTWSDGSKYVGEWKDGKRNGQGTMTLPNGDKYVGGWKNDEVTNGTSYDKDGNIKYKIVNGKGVKQ